MSGHGPEVTERPGDPIDELETEGGEIDPALLGHPRGTLAIVLIYGALFALGWVALYALEFLPRGAPQP